MQGGRSGFRRVGPAVLAAVVATTGLTALAATPAAAIPSFAFTRLFGSDRYATAGDIAVKSFPLGADTVIVATGENFPDALAGNFLAGVRDAPVLLTTRLTPIPPATLTALQTLKARNVILLGLTEAITQAVQDTLAATTSTAVGGGPLVVSRIGGLNRYDTMKAIVTSAGAAAVGAAGGRKTALLASGETFADALAVGPVSFALRFPTILTTPNSLSTAAGDSLAALGIQQVIIPGGPNAISPTTELAVQALGIPTLTRFSGANRSETARIAADFAITNLGFRANHFNVATGDNTRIGVDALAGGPHGGRDIAVNLITNTSVDVGKVVEFAAARSADLVDGHVFGGPVALPDDVLNQVTAAARGEGTVPAAPTIFAISPAAGPSGGGTPFTITGTNLASTSVVDFCGVSTTSLTSTSTTVSGTTPARPNGPCFVHLSAAGGSAGVTFTYTGGPIITSIAPSGGTTAGGTTFTITGTGLAATTSVDFCGAPATSVSAVTTTVTGMTPARPAGACTVTLTTPGGTAVTTFAYTSSTVPTITGISPSSGPIAGSTAFTITGSNLSGATAVDFCGAAATAVSAPNATTVNGTTPAKTAGGACTVTVTTPAGTAATTFTYTSVTAPTITAISPASGPTAGGTAVTITGTNLAGTTAVGFCGTPATNVVPAAGGTTVTATSPARATAGACTVTVTTPEGTAMVTFTYVAPTSPAPTVSGISPTSGSSSGGTPYTITGTNLAGTTSVNFCGTNDTGFTAATSGITITGTTPGRGLLGFGSCTVTVTTPGGSATVPFNYNLL